MTLLRSVPSRFLLVALLAACSPEEGDPEEGTGVEDPALEESPRQRANRLASEGRADEAVTLLETLRREQPADLGILVDLAAAYSKANRLDDAEPLRKAG